MRILFVSSGVLPHVGGVYTYFQNLKMYLESWGHQVDVLAYDPEKRRLHLSGGPSVERALIAEPVERAVSNFYDPLLAHGDGVIARREAERYTFELAAAVLPLHRYHIIHAHDVVAARALARVGPAGVPLVASVHGLFSEELLGLGILHGRDTRAFKYVEAEERIGSRSADRLILPSRWMKSRALRSWGVSAEKVTVIPYGLDLPRFIRQGSRTSAALPDPGGRHVLLTHARLSPEKGHKLLLMALRILAARRRDFVLWLVGDGPSRGPLLRQAARSGLGPYVEFLGTRDDVPALLRRSSLVVMPSRVDNLPHAVMEAQVAALPVVATHVGGIPEMIRDRETGILVPPGNPRALAKAIGRLLDDKAARRRIGAKAAEWGRLAWDGRRMALSTLDVYRSAIESRRKRHEEREVEGGQTGGGPSRTRGPAAEHSPAVRGGGSPGEGPAGQLPDSGRGVLQGNPATGSEAPPDVTVVIPAYNPGHYLKDALRSVMAQTWPGWHILLVDDGSTEDLARFVPRDLPPDRLTGVRLDTNQGQSAALNAALARVTTPYLIQLDPDDWLTPDALGTLRQALETSPPDVALVSANMKMVFEGGRRHTRSAARPQIWHGRAFFDPYAFLLYNLAVWPRFYRTDALRAVGGWPTDGPHGGRYLEDRRILYRLIERYRFGWVDRVLYVYRRHRGNLTHKIAEHNEVIRYAVEETLRQWGAQFRPVFEVEGEGWLVLTGLEPLVPGREALQREMFPQMIKELEGAQRQGTSSARPSAGITPRTHR